VGRLPIKLGLILLVVGIIGAAYASWLGISQIDRSILGCGPGETGTVEPQPAASGAPAASGTKDPGAGMQVVCVDRQGTRRIVTNLPQTLPGEIMSRLGWLVYAVLSVLIAGLGLLLILLGLIARRRRPAGTSGGVPPAPQPPAPRR